MKKTLCLLLAMILVMATSEVIAQEKKSTAKMGPIGEILVDSYQIGVGDILEITTWKDPDLFQIVILSL